MKLPLSVEILHTLDEREQQLFLTYLDSPYHNSDARIRKLATWMIDQQPEAITREAAHECLFPEESFNYDRVSNFFSYLQRHLESFLALEEWKKNSRNEKLWTLKAAVQRGWNRLFEKASGKWDRSSANTLSLAEEDLIHQQEVAFLRNQHHIRLGNRTREAYLAQRGKHLASYSLLARLSNACQWLTVAQVVEGEDSAFMEQEIAALKALSFQSMDHELARIYAVILRMITDPDDESWYQLFRTRLNEWEGFANERRTLFQYAQNYCIRQSNRGEKKYLSELFGIYQQMLDENLLTDQGIISLPDIKNIVSLGVRLEEFAWTKSFLEQYAPLFPPRHRESILTYNRAYLAEAKGNPSEAMGLLRGEEFEDIFYQLGARLIIVKCFYRLRDLDGLESAIHSFSTWLRRSRQVSAYQRKVHLNLLRFIRKLALLRARIDLYSPVQQDKQIEQIRRQISSTKEITNISWVERELRHITD